MQSHNKLVWFTTGSTGLGRELPRRALEHGRQAVVTARDPARVANIAAGHEDAAVALRLDVTKPNPVETAVKAAAQPGPARLAISPYPKKLESTEVLSDGVVVRLRPIRPEDELLLQDLAAHMDPEDMRRRFFSAMRGLNHQLAAQLSQIDYDRQMALIALASDAEEALGVARFSADPDRRRAEFAVAVRNDWKRRGLGHLLMTRLTEIARRRGIRELVGEVLRENTPMLQMCRALGFAIGDDPDDPSLVRVSKILRDDRVSALNWVAVVIPTAVVLVVGIVIATLWSGFGDSEISSAGWFAMGLGVIVTLALGIGLMGLVFISNRLGSDEPGRRDS